MKVLFIGYGIVAAKHHEAITRIQPDTEIFALRSGHTGTSFPNVKDIFSLDELPAEPDFILITNPTHQHFHSIQQVMALNKPLFLEKPLFHTTGNEQKKLVEAISKTGLPTYIGCNLRFHPLLQYLKNYLTEEKPQINEVNIYCGTYLPDWRPGKDFRQFYSVDPAQGGGVHLDVIHEIDYCYWLFGKPVSHKKVLSHTSHLQIEAIDYAHYTFEYPGFYAAITLNYYRRDSKRQLEILTEKGTLLIDFLNNNLLLNGAEIYRTEVSVRETFQLQMDYFISCIKNRQPLMNSISDGYEVLNLCLNETAHA